MHDDLRRSIRSGHHEFVLMLMLAGMSFAGAPAYIIVAGAALLMLSTLYEYAYLQPRFVRAGASRLMAGGIFLAALTSLVFASLCFAVGRLFAWLIAA